MEEQTQKTIDMASQWFDWQRDLWENWMTTTTKGTQTAQSMWQGRTAIDMLTALNQTWFKSFLNPSLGKEPLESLGAAVSKRWQDASTAYTNLLAFWAKSTTLFAQLTPGTVPTTEKLKEIHDQWVKEYQTIMGSLWGTYPSKDAGEVVKAYQSATAASAESGWHFMEPLLKNLEQLPEMLTKMAKGDTAAGAEMIELLRKNYEATLGKALLAPPIGYSREFVERVNRTLDAYIHYSMTLAQYFAPFYQSTISAAEKVFQRLTESEVREVTPEAFREFYRIWWTTNEEVYSEMLGSEQFTKLLGEVLRQGLLFKKQLDDLPDQILKFTNIPTKQEMDELYRAIHDLRKEIRQQRRAIRELEQRLGITVTKPSTTAE